MRTIVGVSLIALLGLTTVDPATAQSIVYQQTIQGGLSVDASGVSTPFDGSMTWYSGDPLEVVMPATATVDRAYLLVQSKFSGFDPGIPYQDAIAVNGVTLASATYLSAPSNGLVRVYQMSPAVFGITGSGSYSYAEQGRADQQLLSGYGVGGVSLLVVYQDSNLGGRRHVVLGTDAITNATRALSGLPTSETMGSMLLSIGMIWDCSDEQSASISVNLQLVSNVVGGRDDGVPFSVLCSFQDWNSLITQGSFGFDDGDTWVGIDGDSPVSEPGGTILDSRLSDELWALPYDESGSVPVTFVGDGDTYLTTFALVIDMEPVPTAVSDAGMPALDTGFNAPNPFQGSTRIEFQLANGGTVTLEVFDVAGRRLTSRAISGRAGWQAYLFDGRDDAGTLLPSGVYFYRFAGAGAFSSRTLRMTILR